MMISKMFKWFAKSENELSKPLAKDKSYKFVLLYGEAVIGFLESEKGHWKFYYSNEFKKNTELSHIVGFPDLNKVYVSDELWPFFKIRIPGLGQPRVRKTIEKENIAPDDELALLKRFGKQSISNPYLLEAVE